tara:strand:+ start:7622 stop:8962 length:1341 start_codon:yes stop_codon:yes gene_type:complete
MNLEKISYFKILLIFTIIISYFLGFFLRENTSGGAESDFVNATWPAIQAIKENFYFSIKNYGKFGDGSWPMFHILNALFNPFTFSEYFFQLSITFVSLLNFFIFESLIRRKFKLEKIDSFLFASVILLLPFFRSSAFWGLTENFGWLFLLIGIKYYLDLEDLLEKKILNSKVLLCIFFLCFFSSLALYTRQYLIFFPIFIFLKLFFIEKNFKILFLISIIYLIFSLPGILLIYLWGGLYDTVNVPPGNVLVNHQPKYIIKNLPFLFSFFAFYLMPFFLVECFSKNIKEITQKYYKSFLIYFLVLILFYLFNFLEPLKNVTMGGGAFLKIDYILFERKLFFFILMSSLGFAFLYDIIKENPKSNLILSFCLLIFCLPKFIFQEYYEPLILILFLLLYKNNVNYFFGKKTNLTIIISTIYFAIYLLGSIYYKYFLFLNFDSWKQFLNS